MVHFMPVELPSIKAYPTVYLAPMILIMMLPQEPSPNGDPTYVVSDIAISKFTPDGSNLIYSTYLGGNPKENLYIVLLKIVSGELVIYGTTSSTVISRQRDAAFQPRYAGGTQLASAKCNKWT